MKNTSQKENDWIITDPSTNQMMRTIEENRIYEFKEDIIVNPETKETKTISMVLDYDELSREEIINSCIPFGYTEKQVDAWLDCGEEIPLMLECVFEMSYF